MSQSILDIENAEDYKADFVLRSPTKGKVYRGPNWNAFNRESLGSIPRKTENILFKDQDQDQNKGFSSETERFKEHRNTETVKYSFPGPGQYDKLSTRNSTDFSKSTSTIMNNPSFSSKGYCSGFISNSQRFDDPKEYYDKFYPGPGQYKTDVKQTMLANIVDGCNYRYKSLYSNSENKSLRTNRSLPGPGYYDLARPNKEETYQPNCFFASKNKRFAQSYQSRVKANSPGPGSYQLPEVSSKLEKTSYYFKKCIPKEANLIEKHLKVEKTKRYSVPGPGEYNLRKAVKPLNDESKVSRPTQSLLNEEIKEQEKSKENELERINILRNIKKDNFHTQMSPRKKGITSVFFSKSSKGTYFTSQHNPGPSYYDPSLVPTKIGFNCNEDKKWI